MKLYSNDLLLLLSLLAAAPQWEALKVLWGDTVESKVDVIDMIVADENSKLDVIEARIDELTPTLLDSSDISGGTITISSAGNYRLEEDVTTNVSITSSSVTLDLNNRSVFGTLSISGNKEYVKVRNGNFFPPAPSSGTTVTLNIPWTTYRILLENLVIVCADSIGVAVKGRYGIRIGGRFIQVLNCVVVSGAASDGDGVTSLGAVGGRGIDVLSTAGWGIIKNCVISTGKGSSTIAAGSTGGAGGIGIYCDKSDYMEIIGCTILETGKGGDGVFRGGAGGTGMLLSSNSLDLAVRDCMVKNIGRGGAGSTAGWNGRGVINYETSATLKSIVLRNKGYNIPWVKFNLVGGFTEKGVQITPYPPTTTAINAYANTYVL